MKRSRFTHKPSETEEKVVMEYKGRYFEVPRSEYQRRLTHIEQAQTSKQVQAVSRIRSDVASTSPNPSAPEARSKNNNTDMVTSFFDQLEQSFKKTMNQSERAQEAPKTPLEHHFTLEDCNESQQTIAERPKDCPIPAESASTAPQDPRLFMDVADSLAQLKSTVTDLIDRTIVDIESKASLSRNVSCETVLMKRALGEGGENSVQNSESYAQSKKAIRSKLYGEIGDIVKRLKDMEFLE
ncbi:uncharacterized protein LOC128093231 [Culex pipiens pallens]|uniref:uncharacterized protein LOC128093231 n=1 Tax=Culex pipiens pallens TaxID=42434 RepID=UPI0022AAF0C5|nr:uncharacterized protein LOC128093231 [Culex pipiens pallens]